MDVASAEELAAQLLGVPSMTALARAQVRRALLPGGRVEAHEYGRKQHSSASAGGMLVGLSGSPEVPDSVVAPLSAVVCDLIDVEGRVRCHDGDVESGDSTWAQAQVLLGLLLRPRLVSGRDRLNALTKRLLSLRAEDGGWPLREGEPPSLTFTFYPVLALARALELGFDEAREALGVTARYVEGGLCGGRFGLEEQVMAHFALERIGTVSSEPVRSELVRRRAELLDACWSAGVGLRMHDQPVTVSRQPVWHSIIWRPLLYLCLRRWVSPLSVLGVLVGLCSGLPRHTCLRQ